MRDSAEMPGLLDKQGQRQYGGPTTSSPERKEGEGIKEGHATAAILEPLTVGKPGAIIQ
ncbi:hypothetical protein [Pasteuria penetrans]|uniref:hypothetical protein n=1 Tax=Pasteuria penetrans TaxID=86005 RepID=UPI00165C7DDE|nr:hypothetical protein [Pasteuria penetrans]